MPEHLLQLEKTRDALVAELGRLRREEDLVRDKLMRLVYEVAPRPRDIGALTERQLLVARTLMEEGTHRRVAERLNISVSAVKQTLSRTYKQLGIVGKGAGRRGSMRAELARLLSGETTSECTASFNEKEKRILAMIADGLTSKDIAKILGNTPYVIKNYIRSIFDKAGVWNRLELANWYFSHFKENSEIQKGETI